MWPIRVCNNLQDSESKYLKRGLLCPVSLLNVITLTAFLHFLLRGSRSVLDAFPQFNRRYRIFGGTNALYMFSNTLCGTKCLTLLKMSIPFATFVFTF